MIARPFVKWAGGKGQALDRFTALYPVIPKTATYHEPFVGSAAVYFHLAAQERLPQRAVLGDVNPDLVTTFEVVRDDPAALAQRLQELEARHSRPEYYRQRRRFNEGGLLPFERAALLIYLNKAGFNGLFRVNSKGEFNVPCGRQASGPSFPGREHLEWCSAALRQAEIVTASFESVLDRARRRDFVYFDPPYVPVSKTASFTDYAANGFGAADQERLRNVFAELDRRGCKLMLSNSDTDRVRELYRGFHVTELSARRSINSKVTARGPVAEVVVRNYE